MARGIPVDGTFLWTQCTAAKTVSGERPRRDGRTPRFAMTSGARVGNCYRSATQGSSSEETRCEVGAFGASTSALKIPVSLVRFRVQAQTSRPTSEAPRTAKSAGLHCFWAERSPRTRRRAGVHLQGGPRPDAENGLGFARSRAQPGSFMSGPSSREQLLKEMNDALESADDTVREAWERVRIEPEKWRCSPWGDQRGGFWAVAEMPREVVWYNDIEEGFNTSPFTTRGTIGEYRCNQAEFSHLLNTLPEALAAEGFAASEAAPAVPPDCAGPGHVVRRQTTYWELQADSGSLVRVHFTRKQEMRFTSAEYASVDLADEHPLLNAYRQPWASVFVTDAKRCTGKFAAELAARVGQATEGWRTAQEYLGLGGNGVLREGYGLLMRAPEPIALIAADVLQAFGAVPSVALDHVPRASTREPQRVRALRMGRDFVIAEAFRFVRLAWSLEISVLLHNARGRAGALPRACCREPDGQPRRSASSESRDWDGPRGRGRGPRPQGSPRMQPRRSRCRVRGLARRHGWNCSQDRVQHAITGREFLGPPEVHRRPSTTSLAPCRRRAPRPRRLTRPPPSPS